MHQAFQVAPGPLYQGRKPVQDEAYARFIRMQACLVCSKNWGVEAAHTGGRGLSQRADGRSRIPLCGECHRWGAHSLHKLGPVRFAGYHKLDVAAAIARLNQFYDDRLARRTA